MATIHDVAAHAGVSAATVSRVINGGRVSAEKSAVVRESMKTLTFSPSRTARSLRTKNSEVIALIIPDIENPFFTSMARGVEDVAQAAGYSVVLCNSDDDAEKETRYLQIALRENMAGVIIAAAGEHSALDELLARDRPVVAVDRGPHGFDLDAVMVDNYAGGLAATRQLLARGYERVACITGPSDVETATQRADGWRQAVLGAKVAYPTETYLRYSNYRVDGGREAMNDLLSMDEPPDAVFIANNLMSVGALQLLGDRAMHPPVVGVATFGDLPYSSLAPADITVVQLPARDIGVTAATVLLERIGGDTQPRRTIVLRNELSGS